MPLDTSLSLDSKARLGAYEPAHARYSRRLTKAKYLQQLLLDTARMLMPVLYASDEPDLESVSLNVAPNAAQILHQGGTGSAATLKLTWQDRDRLALLGDALARQIFRLTGCTAFELRTWHSSLPTQPIQLRLYTETAGALEIFNPRATANRYFHGLRELSESLARSFGDVARGAGDLDRLIAQGEIAGWQAISAAAIRDYHATFSQTAPQSERAPLGMTPTDLSDARTRLGDKLPAVILRLEAHEADLERSIIHRFSRWGQDEHKAPARTEKRRQSLNPALTADLAPLSRSLKTTTPEELMALAAERPLTHLAIEFGVSETALRKRLVKAGWVSPRGWKSRSTE